ncbi:DNA topoisomerase 3 [Saccharicrinis sp. FJH54]|uniref:type IA DNA topoisomerase n=1 Tax=Saccharicrinis sp. FJH54 TaxID=3344665 RepID=UPI0035D51324
MIVCIAEKPSVARDLARILGAGSRKNGYFEGNGYQVTWTFGHLCGLKEPHEYNPNWKRWNLYDLPIVPQRFGIRLIDDEGIKKQFSVIENLVQNAEEVINCGDAGQEGELIQRWVLQKAQCSCPVKRLWISSLTDEAIKEGFEKLYDQKDFESVYYAGLSRATGDWLLGINATRLYTLKYGQRNQLLSVGRVQTPTLALIVERQKEIDNFKPEPYWELRTLYREVWFSYVDGRFSKKEDAEQMVADISGKPFFIVSAETKEGNEFAPKLFDLTSLQVECNTRYGFTADKTLKLIQSLYEKKVTTYPRVDTTFLSDDIYPKIPAILKGLKAYEEYTAPLMQQKIRKTKRVFDNKKVTDHHAIIPTGIPANNLTPDEKLVYEQVTLRFIAAFYPDCKVLKTTVNGKVEQYGFRASGKQIVEPGWRIVLKSNTSDSNDEDQIMPELNEGESGPHEPDLQEKETKPPRYFTEASLLRSMETAGKQIDDDDLRDALKENGIGRPSTRAGIIETLFRRHYIVRDKKRILATETGKELINTIQNELLKSAELTGMWEKKLRQIEEGTYDVSGFISELKEMVAGVVKEVKQDRSNIQIPVHEEQTEQKTEPKPDELICPKCKKGKILKGKGAYGCSRWNEGCDFRLPFVLSGKKLTEKQAETLIDKGKSPLIKGITLGEESTEGHFVLNDAFVPEFIEKEPEKLVCPACKKGEIIKGNKAWGCSAFRDGCRFVIPFIIHEKEIQESSMQQIVLKGKTRKMKGFVINGSETEGYLYVDDSGQLQFGSS